jgi:hypothetical protein
MVGLCPEGRYTAPRNDRMEETSRRQRSMETNSARGQGPEGAVAPYIDWTRQHMSEQISSMHTQANEHCLVRG